MRMFDKLQAWLKRGSKRSYDGVRVIKPDGTTIEGHDAVKAWFDQERQLFDEHGATITFQVYRMIPGAKTIEEPTGQRVAEIKVGGDFVSGTDTVAEVKRKLRSLVERKSQSGREPGSRLELSIGETERISFSFDNRPMMDDKLFYADHFMMLPVWVQVLLHDCDHKELTEVARKQRDAGG